MPTVTLDTPTGTVTFSYLISTPAFSDAPCIDPALPTVVFLHPVYIGKIMYHCQFADRRTRRFNLIGLDLRCHAETIGGTGEGYGREVAAKDVALVMSTLQIPRYHIFGMSMGGCVALQTAIVFPECVQSIFIVSPLPLIETPAAAAGRAEIYELWAEGITTGETLHPGSFLKTALDGTLQLSVNNEPPELYKAIFRKSMEFVPQQIGTVERLQDFRASTVDFFTNREPFSVDSFRVLAKAGCRVQLVYCAADVAYDISSTNEVAERLREAGVDVDVKQVEGAPHFGVVTHPEEVNTLFNDFMLSVLDPAAPPPIPEHVESPFMARLESVGYNQDGTLDVEMWEGLGV
ncbi:Alpha/Beta hydrolase protein [Roridomyces roridus]|uniref:Alpha/Beta hydrolase protein n=1 Tax=Roridomyces roridus TaxID=1738132 RepID=A0AAD7BAT7_9AGAR|nr:Alpha/Beta hydrolase protein [Roridomyces roridus]